MPFRRTSLNFLNVKGKSLEKRYEKFSKWVDQRRKENVWFYYKAYTSEVSPSVGNVKYDGQMSDISIEKILNFSSQDYLGLNTSQDIKNIAKQAIEDYAMVSPASAILGGRFNFSLDLENKIAKKLGKEACLIFPTGWSTGFGGLSGLIRPHDMVVLDALSHNCLQEGARHNTHNVYKFKHNDLKDLEAGLKNSRKKTNEGIFVVFESLYSMNSDSPDINQVLDLCEKYEAISFIDIAHDFGAMGENGLGLLEKIRGNKTPDIIMGAFSKAFCSNGGFIAASRPVIEYLKVFAPSAVFSAAMSPCQSKIVNACFDIAFSEKGRLLRKKLLFNSQFFREQLSKEGIELWGYPSPIVPAVLDDIKLARITSKYCALKGLLVNPIEFPAVPKDKPMFRFQLMATHEKEDLEQGALIFSESLKLAKEEINTKI